MATGTITLRIKLRAWTKALLWLGKRSPRTLGLIILPLGFDRFAHLVSRFGVRVEAP